MKITSKIADRIRQLTEKLRKSPLSRINTGLRPLLKYLRVDTDDKAGLYLTLIVHLLLIIVLLCWSIHTQLVRDTSFVIDFSQQEAQEALEARAQMQESVSEEIEAELDALLNASRSQNFQSIRNVAVDASEPLRDDRHDHPEDIYREARELQERLDQSRREVEEASSSEDQVSVYKEDGGKETEAYQGPSVITGVRIIEAVSSPDQCLRDYALRAASGSRFTASQDAQERQVGEIVYRFVAQ